MTVTPMFKTPVRDCVCGCGVRGRARHNWDGHVKDCVCLVCARPFPPAKAPATRSSQQRAVYARVVDDRARFASGLCEAPAGFHHTACDGYGHHFHHVIPAAKGGPDSFDNGRFLNMNCHAKVHADPAAAKTAGLLEDPPPEENP